MLMFIRSRRSGAVEHRLASGAWHEHDAASPPKRQRTGTKAMKTAEMKLLERAYEAEISSAISGGLGLIQARGKVVRGLVEEGYLEPCRESLGHDRFGALVVDGYRLTQLGRLTYCMSCDE
jgi:hypothetical protein